MTLFPPDDAWYELRAALAAAGVPPSAIITLSACGHDPGPWSAVVRDKRVRAVGHGPNPEAALRALAMWLRMVVRHDELLGPRERRQARKRNQARPWR